MDSKTYQLIYNQIKEIDKMYSEEKTDKDKATKNNLNKFEMVELKRVSKILNQLHTIKSNTHGNLSVYFNTRSEQLFLIDEKQNTWLLNEKTGELKRVQTKMNKEMYNKLFYKIKKITPNIEKMRFTDNYHWEYFDIILNDCITINKLFKIKRIAKKYNYSLRICPDAGCRILLTFQYIDKQGY